MLHFFRFCIAYDLAVPIGVPIEKVIISWESKGKVIRPNDQCQPPRNKAGLMIRAYENHWFPEKIRPAMNTPYFVSEGT